MTRKFTLRMREELLAELRCRAVDARMSLSAWIVSVLEESVRRRNDFERAQQRALRRLETGLRLGGQPVSREELHAH